MKAVRVRIEGQVQGVWFRNWTVTEATQRRLAGWVRNRRDGSVEAMFAGAAESVDSMVAACWHGPPRARVVALRADSALPPATTDFRELPTE